MRPVVYLTRVIGGKVASIKIQGEEAAAVLKSNGFGFLPEDDIAQGNTRPGAVCPGCGLRATTFQKTGRFGCPDCYQHFLPYIGDLLRKMHEGTLHLGKVPAGLQSDSPAEKRLQVWQSRLRDMVARENYEEAAVIRDEITRIESNVVHQEV